jgi:hypothetical protein
MGVCLLLVYDFNPSLVLQLSSQQILSVVWSLDPHLPCYTGFFLIQFELLLGARYLNAK